MMCLKCGEEFDPNINPGGLLVSPPKEYNSVWHAKYHLCISCFDKVISFCALRFSVSFPFRSKEEAKLFEDNAMQAFDTWRYKAGLLKKT